jgi:xanthine/uracil permease
MGLQHVMAMFGATVLVPLILGFNPNTVIFFSGVATLIFLAVTGFKVPSYLGSSFSFIGSVLAVQGAQNPNHGLAYAGIVMAGLIYLVIGAVVHFVGVNPIRYLLPPVVTGTVVAVIGRRGFCLSARISALAAGAHRHRGRLHRVRGLSGVLKRQVRVPC